MDQEPHGGPTLESLRPLTEKARLFWDNEGKAIMAQLEAIPDLQKKQEVVKAVFDLVESPLFQPTDLRHLVTRFTYEPSVAADAARAYNTNEAIASWKKDNSGVKITLHNGINSLPAGQEGALLLSHSIGHELGHSIVEYAWSELKRQEKEEDEEDRELENFDLYKAITDLEQLARAIPIESECGFIQSVVRSNGAESDLARKENMANILGTFIAAKGNCNNFLYRRVKAIPIRIGDEEVLSKYFNLSSGEIKTNFSEIATESGIRDILEPNRRLFNHLDSLWPNIIKRVRQLGLDGLSDEEFEDEIELPADIIMASDTGETGSGQGNEKISTTSSDKKAAPATQPQHKENTLTEIKNCVGGFLATFAEETNPLKISPVTGL